MIDLLKTAIQSPAILILTVLYFIAAAISTFDIRLIQAKRAGELTADDPMLPSWVGFFYYLGWGIFVALLFLNWQYALLLFVIKFILKVLPVLETIGNMLMSPFKPKK
jgi:hypothetical protein